MAISDFAEAAESETEDLDRFSGDCRILSKAASEIVVQMDEQIAINPRQPYLDFRRQNTSLYQKLISGWKVCTASSTAQRDASHVTESAADRLFAVVGNYLKGVPRTPHNIEIMQETAAVVTTAAQKLKVGTMSGLEIPAGPNDFEPLMAQRNWFQNISDAYLEITSEDEGHGFIRPRREFIEAFTLAVQRVAELETDKVLAKP